MPSIEKDTFAFLIQNFDKIIIERFIRKSLVSRHSVEAPEYTGPCGSGLAALAALLAGSRAGSGRLFFPRSGTQQ